MIKGDNRRASYKGIKINSFGLPVFDSPQEENRKESKPKRFYNNSFLSPFNKTSVKDLIVMYDISSDKKKERDWLRRHLIKFGYIMIQKSVWVGPSPLPKDFMTYLKEIKITNNLRILKLSKPYNIKNKIL